MTKKDDGGPAFARSAFQAQGMSQHSSQEGMSLRDYFAIHADVPWNATMETLALRGNKTPTVREFVEYRAALKYEEADAMLAARKKES